MNDTFIKLNSFLKDISYNSKYSFLEEASTNDELIEVAKKRGYTLPSYDLAPFKCIYAFLDEANRNGCILPENEVSSLALGTLIGKSINFDHYQKKIVGHWIDAKIEGDKIIAYGLFFKSALKEDYKIIKELMESGNLKVSFEAHINKEFTSASKKQYKAKDIEFAGGALLITTEPAFAGASVLELASKTRVLEMASVMNKSSNFLIKEVEMDELEKKKKEKARMYEYDMNVISRMLSETTCPTCDKEGIVQLDAVDFEKDTAVGRCYNCGAKFNIDLKPQAKVIKEGTLPDDNKSAIAIAKKEVNYSEVRTMDELIKKLKESASAELVPILEGLLEKAKVEKETEVATIKADIEKYKAEVEAAKVLVETLKAESAEAKTKIEAMATEVASKIQTAKEFATKVVELKNELGEFVKDFKEEDFANETKVILARKDKEIAKLKEDLKVKETAAVKPEVKMAAGTVGVVTPVVEDIFVKQERVRNQMFA